MNFKKWVENYKKAFAYTEIENIKKQGLKLEGHTIIMPNMFDDKSLQLYNTYRIDKTNKILVLATSILAFGTLVLSGLTLYFQYFK